jgi:Mg-chelatase subunit ChlD
MDEQERLRRWRLILGREAETNCGKLVSADASLERVLDAVYDADRRGGLGGSAPNVNRWLGDIRTYFPSSTVKVLQQDALERHGLQRMLLEPELLQAMEPDVHLIGTLLSLSQVIPAKTKETARHVVRQVCRDLERRLAQRLVSAVTGALNKATRSYRPKAAEIDWPTTIRKNLKNYLPEQRTIVPERLVGWDRKRGALRDIVLCVDQSGSMAASVVYSGIFGAVLASVRAVKTKMIVFDTAVVDLTEDLKDPVDLLFGTQLGGGTDINLALGYCQSIIDRPTQTILVLISDLFEGGNADQMLRKAAALTVAGVRMICLLALSDEGTPAYDHNIARALAQMGIPAFACTPDHFPELMAIAIQRGDLNAWAARHGIVTTKS